MRQMSTESATYKAMRAYQHFLYYIDIEDIKKQKVFEGWMHDHLINKLIGMKGEDNVIRAEHVARWINELDAGNIVKLYEYIAEHHRNKW